MKNFDYDIIRTNVDILMRNNNMKQTELARVLGMSQSNVSKALSNRDKKYFTLEQLYSIAEYFGVSMDWLTGRNVSDNIDISEKSIARFTAELLSCRILKTGNPPSLETAYRHADIEDERLADHLWPKDVYTESIALYFPGHYEPKDYEAEENEYREITAKFEAEGNDAPGLKVNRFLEKYLKILKLYHSKEIDEEAYQLILNKYLDSI